MFFLCALSPELAYGDSMILAERIFSQSAPGEVSGAYFRGLADFGEGVGGANFRKHATNTKHRPCTVKSITLPANSSNTARKAARALYAFSTPLELKPDAGE